MAQHDYVIANGTGAAVRSDLNNALAAIVSQNSGATAPATTYAFQFWADTTTGLLKLRNSANSAWVTLFQLDGEWSTLPVENGTAAAPSIYFKDSGTDTGFYSPGTDQVGISTAGTSRLTIDANGNLAVDTNTLYVDAPNNRVGIGTTSPSTRLHVQDTSGSAQLRITGTGGYTELYSDGNFYIQPNGSTKMVVQSGGNVGIGSTAPDAPLCFAGATGKKVNFYQGSDYSIGVEASQLRIAAVYNTVIYRGGYSGSETARFDLDGRLLVGTSTAATNYRIGTSSFTPIVQVEGTSPNVSPLAIQRTDGAPYLYIATGVNVSSGSQIGYISFNAKDGTNLVQAAQIGAECDGTPGANDMPGRLVFSTTADGASSPTERMRINSSGQPLFHCTSPTAVGSHTGASNVSTFNFSGITLTQYSVSAGFYYDRLNFTNAQYFVVNSSGTGVYLGNGSTSWTAYSDERLKTNIVELDGATAWNHCKTARAVTFNWKPENYPDSQKIGFIAQDWEAFYPEVITTTNETIDGVETPKGMQYTETIPVLMAALKEAITKIETLEAKVAALESA